MTKDYYQILGVAEGGGAEEIRRAYRKKAFELHPDRNGGSREAEEAFKNLTEAYAVLSDPDRRAAYDAARRRGTAAGPEQAFDPGDVFAEVFRNPAFSVLFSQLAREFDRQGLRFDEAYLRKVFSAQRGGVYFGGFVFAGPLGSLFTTLTRPQGDQPVHAPHRQPLQPRKQGLLGRLLGAFLPATAPATSRSDTRFTLPVREEVLKTGGKVRISVPGPAGTETYEVQIAPGSRPGTQLRLAGRGAGGTGDRGDLYLELRSEP